MVSWVLAALIVAGIVAREWRARSRLAGLTGEAAVARAAVETLSLELRCGAAPLEALRAVVPAGRPGPAAAALSAAAAAETMSEAAAHLETGSPELRALGSALRLVERSGISLAALTAVLDESLQDQLRNDRELADALAGVRSSVDLLTGLPLLGILLAAGVGARPLHVLFHTTAGAICLDLGVGFAALGRLWTGQLIERARVAGRA